MKKLYKKLSEIGIKEGMSAYERKSIILLNSILMLFIVFFGFISIMSYRRLDNPIIGNLYLANVIVFVLSFFINKYSNPNISKFLISIFIPVSLVFVGAYAKSKGVTDNLILYLSPRMLLSITIIVPVLLFGYQRSKKTILAILPGLLVFIFYDKIHQLFGVYLENLKFEPEFYGMFLAMIILFIFFTIASILFYQNINKQNEEKLYRQNEELAASEEELKQQNEELLTVNDNLEKQKRIILEQKNEMQKLLTAVEQSENAIMITDISGKIEYANPSFSKLSGYELEEVIGKKPNFLRTDYHESEFYKELWDTILAGKVWKGIFLNKKKDKSLFWDETTISPVRNLKNEITHFVAIKDDITQRVENEKKLAEAYKIIKEKNESITRSISYAEKIQLAILASDESILKKNFSDYFIINRPAEIVSGDFYYFSENEDYIYVAVGDCTGHGVPGGFMTMLGYVFLDDIVNNYDLRTGEILNLLRNRVIDTIGTKETTGQQDGIDLAICKIEKKTLKTEFSGAYNPLVIISQNEFKLIKGNRFPIGTYPVIKNFDTNELQLNKNDLIYLFSDGYQDQFGGENNKKFYSKNFHNLLFSIRNETLADQKKILESTMDEWLAGRQQLDDILIVGIKI